jgi:hypothetical protein
MGNLGNNMTAMSTAKSGYIQRKIVKVCEDIQVQNDQTVRDATGKIYQFAYGETGYDPVKTIRVDGKPSVCDISRLVDRMNTCFEMGIEEELDDLEPETSAEIVQPPTKPHSHLRDKLVDKIRQKQSNTVIDEDWSVAELRQRLQAIELEQETKVEESEADDSNAEAEADENGDDTTTIDEEDDGDKLVKDEEDEDATIDEEDDDEDEFPDTGAMSDVGDFADD